MAENPVSYWESSSSSSSAGSNDSNANNNNQNSNASNTSNTSNTSNDNEHDYANTHVSNDSSTGSYPTSSTDSWKSHPWPPDPITNATAANRDLPTDDEEEVIFELNEEAMAQLPAHLQYNMRNIQWERLERVERENAQVPVRRYRAQREREEEEEKRRADEWFRGLIGRLPPAPVLGVGVGLGATRRDEGGGDERDESPSPRGPGRRGRAWRDQFTRRVSEGRGHHNGNNTVEESYTENDMEYAAKHARGRKMHHHHHRAASSKGKAAVYNNQPYLPGSQSATNQYYTGQGDVYGGQQEEEEYDESAGSCIKRAGMHRVKRSIGKMSRFLRKE